MPISPFPAPLEPLAGRRFSFYPPIQNIGCNEWMYRRATWTECIVVNTSTGEEFSIPRSFLGEITTGGGLTVVALHRELESREGTICPIRRPVIELPVAVNDVARPAMPERLAPVINIRLEQRPELRIKKLGVALVLGAVACAICADMARQIQLNQRYELARWTRPYLQLSADDDYFAATHKLGAPRSERVLIADGGRVFRVLDYGPRRFEVVLMGPSRSDARYIGTLSGSRIVDAVRMPGGSGSSGILRKVPQF